jgi:hypothetical protein
MKTKTTLAMLAFLGAIALTASAQDDTKAAPGDVPPPAQHQGAPRAGFHLLPPPLVQQMNLTDDQKTQVAALEADTKAKLEKILTADQLKQLNNFHPPRGGMGGANMRGGGRGGNGPGGDNFMPPPGGGDNNGGPGGPPPGDNQ